MCENNERKTEITQRKKNSVLSQNDLNEKKKKQTNKQVYIMIELNFANKVNFCFFLLLLLVESIDKHESFDNIKKFKIQKKIA